MLDLSAPGRNFSWGTDPKLTGWEKGQAMESGTLTPWLALSEGPGRSAP